MKNKIINIILILLILFQIVYFKKYTFNDYLFSPSKTEENNEYVFNHLDLVYDILFSNVELKDENIFLHYNQETAPYDEYGIGYLYTRWKFFPNYVPSEHIFNIEKYDIDLYKKADDLYNLGYLIIIGKDTEIFDYKTSKDFTLIKVEDSKTDTYTIVNEIDFNIYDIYKLNDDNFDKFIKEVKKNIEMKWNFYCINLMRNFALDLYKHSDYEKAKEYGNYYLNNVDKENKEIKEMLESINRIEG